MQASALGQDETCCSERVTKTMLKGISFVLLRWGKCEKTASWKLEGCN